MRKKRKNDFYIEKLLKGVEGCAILSSIEIKWNILGDEGYEFTINRNRGFWSSGSSFVWMHFAGSVMEG